MDFFSRVVGFQNVRSRGRDLCSVPGMWCIFSRFLWFSLKNAKNVRMRMSISSRMCDRCVNDVCSWGIPVWSLFSLKFKNNIDLSKEKEGERKADSSYKREMISGI